VSAPPVLVNDAAQDGEQSGCAMDLVDHHELALLLPRSAPLPCGGSSAWKAIGCIPSSVADDSRQLAEKNL